MGASPSVTGPVGIYVGMPNAISQSAAAFAATAAGLSFVVVNNPLIQAAASTAAALARLAGQIGFLGTSQRGPRIKVRRAYSRVFNDITGAEIAFDKIWAGAEALVFMDLTRWDETIYRFLGSRPRAGATEGAEPPGTRGTLMMTEGACLPIYLRFPAFDFHPVFRAQGGLAGYRLLAGSLEGDDDYETGTGANMRHVAIHCQEIYDPKSNGLALFDHNMTGVPALLPS